MASTTHPYLVPRL